MQWEITTISIFEKKILPRELETILKWGLLMIFVFKLKPQNQLLKLKYYIIDI